MIYLDHAATSWPKPPAVLAAMQRWFDHVGVSPDRGDGPHTADARRTVRNCREHLGRLIGVDGDQVAFVSGATEGLNLALRALLRGGERVMTTTWEHSSVVRPLLTLRAERMLHLEVVPLPPSGDPTGTMLARIEAARPDLLVCTHASNVTGAALDAATLCVRMRALGGRTLVDASQTAGLLPIDVGADVLVASAHKALHGPPGLGFVAVRGDLQLAPQKQGGSGSSRALEHHPHEWPQAFEAGTPNTPAIYGLAAALDWLDSEGPHAALARALACVDHLRRRLAELAHVRVIAADTPLRTPILSMVHADYDPLELGALLAAQGMHVRAGFHCAPWIHATLGTETTGTLRISAGPSTHPEEIDRLRDVLAEL